MSSPDDGGKRLRGYQVMRQYLTRKNYLVAAGILLAVIIATAVVAAFRPETLLLAVGVVLSSAVLIFAFLSFMASSRSEEVKWRRRRSK